MRGVCSTTYIQQGEAVTEQARPGSSQGWVNLTLTNPSPYQSASHSRRGPHARKRGGPERTAHTQHTRGAVGGREGSDREEERRVKDDAERTGELQ